MEWFIPENSKIVFNVSAVTSRCVDNDRISFANGEEGVAELSDFVITLLNNFAPHSETSIHRRLEEKECALQNLGVSPMGEDGKRLMDAYKVELVRKAMKRLEKAKNGSASTTRRVNVSAKLQRTFDQTEGVCGVKEEAQTELFKGKPGYFIRVLLEEYAELPSTQRERYFFAEMYDKLSDAINGALCVEISRKSRVNRRDRAMRNSIDEFRPYAFDVDPATGFNYVIGLNRKLPLAKENPDAEWRVCGYRLCRIADLRIQHMKKSCPFTNEEKKQIVERRQASDVAAINFESAELTVGFTADGVNTLVQIAVGRPRLRDEAEIKKLSSALQAGLEASLAKNAAANEENATGKKIVLELVFVCPSLTSQSQAQTYFRRFGCDAVIQKVNLSSCKTRPRGVKEIKSWQLMQTFYHKASEQYLANTPDL